MPIKGTGGSSQGEGKKKQTDGRGENRWEKKGRKTEEKPDSVIETERNKRTTTDREAR